MDNNLIRPRKEKTIFRHIAIPMILMLLAQTTLLILSFATSGVFVRLRENERALLEKQVENRAAILEGQMVSDWMDLGDLGERINHATMSLLEQQTITLETLAASSDACMPILTEIADDLLLDFRSKKVSGIYVIFNTQSLRRALPTGAYGRRPGLYIRDMDPAASASPRNEDLLFEYAPSELVRSMNIATDNNWSAMFQFSETENPADYAFFSSPFQTAYEDGEKNDAEDYGFWSVTPFATASHEHTLSYSVPLMLSNGTVYGVLGVDIAYEYLKQLIPYDELFDGTHGHYLIGSATLPREQWRGADDLFLTVLTTNGDFPLTKDGAGLHLTRFADDEYAFLLGENEYICSVKPFSLYSSNAPFENERWFFIGTVERTRLNRFPDQVTAVIAVIVTVTFFFGVITTFVFSRRISSSIRTLSGEVQTAQRVGAPLLTLSKTGIGEIDVFSQAITRLSRERQDAAEREQQVIKHERDYDPTTDLKNRRAFYNEVKELFTDPAGFTSAAMMMLDLDNLKSINDKFGHETGDAFVRRAGRVLKNNLPTEAVIGRLSGDEFLVFLWDKETGRPAIETAIQTFINGLSHAVFEFPDKTAAGIAFSGGIAWYPENTRNLDEMIRMADAAMTYTKKNRKGNIENLDPATYDIQNSFFRELEQLDELVRHPELLTYHFQPIINAHDGSIHAYEALMRISLPLLHNPEEVLRLAHEERRLHEIEFLTWQRSFACYRDLLLKQEVTENVLLFINSIASEHLNDAETNIFLENNADLIDRLVIEITEAENVSAEAMAYKRNLPGFNGAFALDDYGSGYNSQKMLLELKPKYIKIDMSIIRDIDSSPDKQRIVSSIVEYAHERDMLIIAEGLETEAELAKVLALDVDLLQGYYIARPSLVPLLITPEAAALIAAHSAS